MALSATYLPSGQEKLFYFTGKVRAFWKDKIFFMDQRNAAVIGFENLYINGEKACQTDLHRMDAKVASSDWESAPVFYSYVVYYNSSEAPPWPYKLKGKKLWLARYAWTGAIPVAVEEQIQRQNVVYMPLTYFTGKLINLFDDKVLYGDYRNNVMAHLSDLSIYGQRADYRDTLMHFDHHTPVIHSFVLSLPFLTGRKYEGPEPNLPTWPIDNYGPSTWVAKFAWQGEMPDEFRQQLSRFQIIKITQWVGNGFKSENIQRPLGLRPNRPNDSSFSVSESAKGKETGTAIVPEPLLVTTQKEAAIIKGCLILANHKYGLINSYLDVIVFSTKNFYVNGEMFREGTALDDFFHDRKVPLTAWIVPLPEPVLVFDVYVMWRAVCVWYGVPPKNMEAIKKRYDGGSIAGSVPEALNTASDNRYTLVLGEIVSLTYNSGSARAKVGNKMIDVTFKRKAVYMNGYKLHTKCSLTEIKQALESGIWNMLVYPVVADNVVMYTALALWQYQYQHYVSADLLYRILLEGGSVDPESGPPNPEAGDQSEEDKMGRHMTGLIVKTTPDYGILETRSVTIEPSYVFFLRTDFYMDGEVLEGKEMLHSIDRERQVNLYARSAKHQEIKTYPIIMYATLVWMGKKPPPSKYSSSELLASSPTNNDTANGHSEDNSCSSPGYESPDDLSTGDGNFQKAVQLIKPDTPTVEYKIGRFAFLRDRYGVIRCGSNLSGSYTYVLFDFSIVWIDGDRIGPTEGLYDSVIDDEVQCNCIAYAIPNVDVGGHKVSMQASAVWVGKKPFHVEIPVIKCPLKAMEALEERMNSNSERKPLPKKVSEYVTKSCKPTAENKDRSSGITDILAKVTLKDSSTREERGSPEGLQDVVIDPKKPYCGKHISGRIVKLMKDKGIAMWRCAAKEGEVYILFNRKNVFVNLCPMDEDYKLGQVKSCNLYVIPTRHKAIENYRVSLYATCGWIGSKPRDIPAPGDQDHAHISLEHVFALEVTVGKNVTAFIVKIKEKTGVARWRSVAHGGDIFIEFDKALTCDNIQSYFNNGSESEDFSRACHFYVKPMEQKDVDGYTVSLSALYGWSGKKPSHFPKPTSIYQPSLIAERLHVTPVDPALFEIAAANKARRDLENTSQIEPKSEGLNTLDSLSVDTKGSPESKERRKKKNRMEVWEDEESTKLDLEGKIVELHSNVGKIQGIDESQYFFSRENSYLYGVCLSNVELWHVLVQDVAVTYRLTEISAGQEKVSKMWIGPEKIEADKAAAHIYEWCKKNLVPEGARDMLIHQLEMTNGNSSATKESS